MMLAEVAGQSAADHIANVRAIMHWRRAHDTRKSYLAARRVYLQLKRGMDGK